MASNWDTNWEDEEWLKKQNAATLHSIFKEAQAQGKDSAKVKKVVVDKLHTVTDFNEVNSYDLLAFLKVADDADLTVTSANNQSRDLKAEMDAVIEKRRADLKDKTDLISRLNRKALLEAAKITKKEDAAAAAVLNTETNSSVVSISETLENTQEITDAEFDAFDNADKAGALDDIAASTKEAFIKRLAELSGWDKTEGRIIEKNDNALLNAVTSLDVYKKDGGLNDVYADCAELADKLTFEYPEGTTEAQKADLAKAYKQQLLSNAAMRATNEILKDRSFIMRHKTAEDILSAYKGEVARQFERGVVVAGLTTSQATGIMLDKITRNKDGKIEYDGGADDAIKQAIADVLEGKASINPLTLQMDTYQLDIENRKVAKALKLKKLDSKKLGFWNKAKAVVKAASDNILKKGGWKKIAVNAAVFGGAAAAMVSGSALVIGAGVALYTGMTAVNAWVMPAYDSLSNEMYERKISGFKARLAYLKQNFNRAFKAKREEPDFKKRAWWRTAEGVVVGGLTGGMGALGVTGWTKIFSRQGTMAVGKAGSLIRSWFGRNKAKKNLETTYSMDNFKVLQTAEGYLKQDQIALAAVIGGAVVADTIKSYVEDGAVADLVSSVKAKVAGLSGSADETVAETTGLEEAKDIGVKDDAGKGTETETVATDVDNNETAEVKDTEADKTVTEEHSDSAQEVKKTTGNAEQPSAYEEIKLNSHGPYKLEEVNFSDYENLKPYNKADMGITFGSYKTLIRIYGAEELDRMLGTLNREGVMDNFKDLGLTKEQLLVRFRGLDATTDRVGRDGFSIQGAVRYHHEEAMTYLNKLFGPCGDQITAEQYNVIKQSLAVVDNQGGYHGEGIVPTSSVHIRAHGYNSESGDCGRGEYNQFKLGRRINVKPTPIHEPVINEPVIETPEPQITPQDFSVENGHVEGSVNTAVAPEAAEIKVNFTDPSSRATAYLANGSQDYDITGNIPEGAKYVRMDGHGNLYLWQKGAVVAGSEDGNQVISGAGGVESIHATALSLKMDNLGAAKISETEGGISFQYGKGKHALTFILDKNSGEMRTFLGSIKDKNEIILDQATSTRAAAALTGTMNESGLAARYHLSFGAETEQNNNHLEQYIDTARKGKVEQSIDKDIAGAVRSGADAGMSTTQFETPEVVPSYTPTGLTAEQNAALLSDKAVITATGIDKNGQMVFQVQGVDGVDRLSMPALKTVSIAEGQQATVVMDPSRIGSTDALHRSVVRIPGADGKNYTVEINTRGGAARVLDEQGKKVFLDKESSAAFAKTCKETLEASGIKGVGNINLNPYPEGSLGDKCAKIYQVAASQQRMQNVLGGRSK